MRLAIKCITALIPALFATCSAGATSFDGEWTGSMQCGASLLVQMPAFSNPIAMVVTGDAVTLTRDTNVVTESLTGKVARNGQTSLFGNGKFKARRGTWTIEIEGKFSGNLFKGNGPIYTEKGDRARDCSVELAKVVTEAPKAAQRSDTKSALPAKRPPIVVSAEPAATPAPIVKPANPTAQASAVAPPVTATEQDDKTITGTMKWGTTDSCLEVQNEKNTKCYGFAASGAVASTLRSACSQGDKCTVTGKFDDDKEEVLSVTTAAVVADNAAPAAKQEPTAIAPVASSPPAPPLAESVPAPVRDFTTFKYALGAAGIFGLLAGFALFTRSRRNGKMANRQQAAKVEADLVLAPVPMEPETMMSVSPIAPMPTAPVASDLTYQVVLNGIQPGKSSSDVRAKFAALFKATSAQVDSMLASNGYVLKKGVGLDAASNYKAMIEAAGGICDLIEEGESFTFDPSPPNPASQTHSAARAIKDGADEPQRTKPEASSPLKQTYHHYSDVPWYRKQWVFWLTYLIVTPAALGILMFGDVYYEKRGELKSFGLANRIVAGIFGVFFVLSLISAIIK